jgi:hypothetical protein
VNPKERKHALILVSIALAGIVWLAVVAWMGFRAG